VQRHTSSTAVPGWAFAKQTVIRVEDQYVNLRSSDKTTVVTAARAAGSGTLQGTTNMVASGGIVSFTNLSHAVATNITILFSSGSLTGATSSTITVTPAAASKLTLQQQPSATATAGAAFAQQPKIRIEDQFGNLRSSDNGTTVTASRNAGSGGLQGTTSLGAINGVVGFTNLSHNVATTITMDFNSAGLTGATSANVVVSPAGFARLQLLVPGETAAPGTVSGKIGTAMAQTAGAGYSVTVNAVDTNWNLVNTVIDTVGITSSDANPLLPGNAALNSGSGTFSVTCKTAGSRTVTATDVSDGSKTANTSPSITVNAGTFAKLQLLVPGESAAAGTASGKTGAPSAEQAGTSFNVTVNAVDGYWNLVNTATDTVGITCSDTNATLPINTALVSGTRALGVTLKTTGAWTITATDISNGSKTASTSPPINVNSGAPSKLTLQTQPSPTATAGV